MNERMKYPPSTFDEALARAEFSTAREGQREVFNAFRAGKHVVLHAPTGWGKTFAVLAALGDGHAIYSLPLRVLVDSLVKDANDFNLRCCKAQHGARREHKFLDPGVDPDDPIRCVFTTLDQSLSAFLGIPVGVSIRQGNILPAVVDASHLIFDEFHLFDPSRSWTTALFALLTSRQNGMVLTATLSDPMLDFLVDTLGNTEHGVELVQTGRPFPYAKQLVPGSGFSDPCSLSLGERTIIIRNQIEWAKETAQKLRKCCKIGPVYLLHSELLPHHRSNIETKVRDVFGKEGCKPAVLVSTQVVEAGIDLTCDVMHTDLCPPSSFIQRVGRCARFEGKEGTVYWHPVETASPYQGAEAEVDALAGFLASCAELTPGAEHSIVNLTADRDREAIAAFRLRNDREVARSRIERDYGMYGEMIRHIESVNVAVGTALERSYHFISLAPGKFYGNGPYSEVASTPVRVDYDRRLRQRVATTTESIRRADFVLLDPEQIGYRPDYGLCVGEIGGEEYFGSEATHTRIGHNYEGNAEQYRLHIERLQQQRRVCQWMVDRMAGVFQEHGADADSATHMAAYLADLIIWAHDLGKLDFKWQAAHGVFEGQAPYPIAHSGKEDYPRLHKPPPHAWVSAWAVRDYLWNVTFEHKDWHSFRRPVFWAIAEHHGYSRGMQRQSMHAYRLVFLDYLDAMQDVEFWRDKGWNRSILTTQVAEADLDDIWRYFENKANYLREKDAHEIYYMLSYILRRSDQLATALVSNDTEETITPTQRKNFV